MNSTNWLYKLTDPSPRHILFSWFKSRKFFGFDSQRSSVCSITTLPQSSLKKISLSSFISKELCTISDVGRELRNLKLSYAFVIYMILFFKISFRSCFQYSLSFMIKMGKKIMMNRQRYIDFHLHLFHQNYCQLYSDLRPPHHPRVQILNQIFCIERIRICFYHLTLLQRLF